MMSEAKPRIIEYHNSKTQLRSKEYGRNIQIMIEEMLAEQEPQKKYQMANEIVRVMSIITSGVKDQAESRRRIWEIFYQLTNYEFPPELLPYPLQIPPPNSSYKRIPYNNRTSRYKQYGKNIELMVQKAVEMPNSPEKQKFILQIASIMKQYLQNYASGGVVNDKIVFDHLYTLSDGAINMNLGDIKIRQNYSGSSSLPQSNASQSNKGSGFNNDRSKSSNAVKLASSGQQQNKDRNARSSSFPSQNRGNTGSNSRNRRK